MITGFGIFTFVARKYIYNEIVKQVIKDNQVIANQIVDIIKDLQLKGKDQEQTKQHLKKICNDVQLPNSGFLCAINRSGDVIAAPWLDERPNVNLSNSELRKLNSDSTFKLRTMRAVESFKGYATLPDNHTDVVVSLPLQDSGFRILVHQNNAAIEKRAQSYVGPLMLIGGAVSLILAIVTYFATDRIISRYQFRIEVQNNELRDAYTEIKEKNEEIAAQRDELQKQRDVAQQRKKEITQSIEYAWHIQNAMLPSRQFIADMVQDYMIFLKPKDIVSGDFYWFNRQGDRQFIVAADCTGHGVPGAFMSMLGMTFLNEAVVSDGLIHPDDILGFMREKIISALNQQKKDGENFTYDGIDMALITIDPKTMHLEFAGAQNPLYLIRNKELSIIKPDRIPVGIHKTHESFSRQSLQLQHGDNLYMFSDGFPDQFGGENGKKFRYKAFRQLILDIHQKEFDSQQAAISQAFEKWKGQYEQVDDVLVLGLKV